MSILPLRDYQAACVDAVEGAWGRGMRRPAAVLPTGAGKTVVFAHLIRRGGWRRERFARALVLAHRTELIEQAARTLKSISPDLRVGIVKASRNETLADVIVGSVQTLATERRRRQLLDVGLVVVDEAHHATAATYRRVLEDLGCFAGSGEGGAAVALGVTATMSRGDGGALGAIWQDVVYRESIADMIAAGWLVRPRGIRVKVDDLDLSQVKRVRGDYSESQLGEAIEASMAPEAIAKALREHAGDRPTLLFAPLVRTAEIIRDALRDAGFTAEVVSALTSPDERRRIVEDFRARRVQVLCNAMVFTEGTDLPLASCVVVARPTTHAGLYVQMVGRVLRPDQGKDDALVLDVVGASQKHALAAHVELFGEEPKPDRERDDLEEDDLDEGELTLAEGLGLRLDEESWANGPLKSVEVDLFHGSASAWLRTRAGVWFIPAGERYIAIIPGDPGQMGGYDVVEMHRYSIGRSAWVQRGVSELAYAMAWAEAAVTPSERSTALRERSWRARRPSVKQRDLAARYGVMISPDMHSGEVSSRISVELASRRIDHRLPAYVMAGAR